MSHLTAKSSDVEFRGAPLAVAKLADVYRVAWNAGLGACRQFSRAAIATVLAEYRQGKIGYERLKNQVPSSQGALPSTGIVRLEPDRRRP